MSGNTATGDPSHICRDGDGNLLCDDEAQRMGMVGFTYGDPREAPDCSFDGVSGQVGTGAESAGAERRRVR